MRKNSVCWDFCTTFRKKCQKTGFLTFLETLSTKVAKHSKKQRFFDIFERRLTKSVGKQCFFTFFETFCTKFAKMRKTAFFELFSRHSAKNMRENSVFSRSSRQFVLKKFAKNAEKQRFLSFLRYVLQKSFVNSVFPRLSRHFVQSLPKIQKNSVF